MIGTMFGIFLSTHKKSENIGRFSICGAVYLTLGAALGVRSEGRCGDVIVLEKRHLFNTTIVRNFLSSFLKAWRTGLSKPVITMASTGRISS